MQHWLPLLQYLRTIFMHYLLVMASMPPVNSFTYHLATMTWHQSFPVYLVTDQWILASKNLFSHKNLITVWPSSADYICTLVVILKCHNTAPMQMYICCPCGVDRPNTQCHDWYNSYMYANWMISLLTRLPIWYTYIQAKCHNTR